MKDKQYTIEDIEREIQRELGLPEAFNLEPPPVRERQTPPEPDEKPRAVNEDRTARKPFRITDFDVPHDREMAVFTHAKKLAEYIFVITEKSPKKLRWSIITRMQNCAMEVVDNLYSANFEREEAPRTAFQKRAGVSLSLLDFYTELALTKQAINLRQASIVARQLAETRKLLNGWVKSTKNPRQ